MRRIPEPFTTSLFIAGHYRLEIPRHKRRFSNPRNAATPSPEGGNPTRVESAGLKEIDEDALGFFAGNNPRLVWLPLRGRSCAPAGEEKRVGENSYMQENVMPFTFFLF